MPISGSGKRILYLALIPIMLAGCKDEKEPVKPSGQIVANVNGTEITYLQLNHLLQTTGVDPTQPGTKNDAVDALVERELLVQEALNAKLDRDAEVLQAVDTARQQILIDAYAQRMVFPAGAIGESEKKTYYAEHPELFEQRRVYQLTVFAAKSTELTPTVMAALDHAKTPEATRQALEEARVHYTERSGEQSAEQLPLGMLKQFAAAEVGDILASAQGDTTNLMQITAAEIKPVPFAEASSMIEQYLLSTRNRDALAARVKQLREHARVAVADEFAGDKAEMAVSASQ